MKYTTLTYSFINVIFLDIDGVLNGYNFWNLLGWDIISKFKSNRLKSWYRELTEPFGVHESKVKRLAKIVHKTDAEVVISSSWRSGLQSNNLSDSEKRLLDLFDKYDIEIYDYTPILPSRKRENEIMAWLFRNPQVNKFIILDDENADLLCFIGKELIQTSSVSRSRMIKGQWFENTGLKNKHVRQAIRMLNGE